MGGRWFCPNRLLIRFHRVACSVVVTSNTDTYDSGTKFIPVNVAHSALKMRNHNMPVTTNKPPTFIARKSVLTKFPRLGAHVRRHQDAILNSMSDKYQAGDRVLMDDGQEPEVLTIVQAERLNREACSELSAVLDVSLEHNVIEPRAHFVARPLKTASQSLATDIGCHVQSLLTLTDTDTLLVLPYLQIPFLNQKNEFELAARAIQRLIDRGLKSDFYGAICLGPEEASTQIIADIFTLIRYNASAPTLVFYLPHTGLLWTVCQYGNLHIENYTRPLRKIHSLLQSAEFTILSPDEYCLDIINPEGSIPGRLVVH